MARIDVDGDLREQLRRHVPSRHDIAEYAKTMRQVGAIFETYLLRLQRRGIADPKKHLDQMRGLLLDAYRSL